jgi:hypothetical protein
MKETDRETETERGSNREKEIEEIIQIRQKRREIYN